MVEETQIAIKSASLIATFSSIVGGVTVAIILRLMRKSEDSASREYVDSRFDKMEEKIGSKADKVDINQRLDGIERKVDMLLKFQLEKSK
jgi:tetrahydromethanopterin S-methyltransferase subunit G